jgi:hypothetical protein
MDPPRAQIELPAIDWTAPWFAPWRDSGEPVALRVRQGMPLHDALNAQQAAPVRFVEQAALPPGQAYEHYVFGSSNCPVRPGLHDFFNGLCWIGMPATKARLNALQAAQIEARGVGAVRGPVRDAITLFDENGALLDAPPELWSALLERDWKRLFVELRPLWDEARLLIAGHALLEKLVSPRKVLTAHVWRLPLAINSIAQADALLAPRLTAELLAGKPFTPLPVMGIPRWCRENSDVSFYDDAQVFRPRRAPERITTPHLRSPRNP